MSTKSSEGQFVSNEDRLRDIFKLPPLTKLEQIEIINDLSKSMEVDMTPKQLVQQLNEYIVSQGKAKRIVSQAIRNKYRMSKVDDKDLRSAMRPSNILVSGKSGSGKTEIFRQISKLYNAPFIRVEATRYTEVGYHGEDVTNIISDLFKKTQAEMQNKEASELFKNSAKLKTIIHDHLLKIQMGPSFKSHHDYNEKLKMIENGDLDELYCFLFVPLDIKQSGKHYITAKDLTTAVKHMRKGYFSPRMTLSPIKIKEIRKYMYELYAEELFVNLDLDEFVKNEIENKAIVVIDEIDKLVRQAESSSNTKASDEGVQYDLLPLLDGTTVNVKSNIKLNTRNILFVGAGAFEKAKPTELAIELQGRMPISAKMESLTKEDFVNILKNTKHNLLLQSISLLKTEGVNILFENEAIDEMAQISVELNEEDNIGARRLRTVVDAILEDINFEAPDFEVKGANLVISKEYVRETTKNLYQNRNFKKYIM